MLMNYKELISLYQASIISIHVFHTVDKLLKDVCRSDLSFGEKVVLLVGDFKQLLPTLRKGKAAQIIEYCSPRWHSVTQYNLCNNMQLRPEGIKFCRWLLVLILNQKENTLLLKVLLLFHTLCR